MVRVAFSYYSLIEKGYYFRENIPEWKKIPVFEIEINQNDIDFEKIISYT